MTLPRTKPRYIQCESWEAAAMAAGKMTQKRIPLSHYRVTPGIGALIWVQEPYVEWFEVGHPANCAIGYRGDAGPQGGIWPPMPDAFKKLNTKGFQRFAKDMRAGDSRLTLELTGVREGAFIGYAHADRDREGFDYLAMWNSQLPPVDAWWAFWRRQYSNFGPMLTLTFRVHQANVSELMRARETNAA